MEAHFGPFGDSANLDARSVHGLRQTYHRLENNFGRTRLNPGQLLGFLVSHHGIEASAKQIRAITEMGPPRSVKDV